MKDVFVERMVKKKLEAVDFALMAGILLAAVAVAWIGFVLGFFILGFPMITVFLLAGAVYGAYKLIGRRQVEFEYSLTNGYVTVDKILQKSVRRRLTAFECESCQDMGRYGEQQARLQNQSFDERVFATRSSDRSQAWYMIVRSPKTGKTLVVFEPDEDLLAAIQEFLPRQLKFEKGWK